LLCQSRKILDWYHNPYGSSYLPHALPFNIHYELSIKFVWSAILKESLLYFTYVRSWALPEKLPIVQPFRKFPAILRNPKFHHRVH
jgi:hypothetical protein